MINLKIVSKNTVSKSFLSLLLAFIFSTLLLSISSVQVVKAACPAGQIESSYQTGSGVVCVTTTSSDGLVCTGGGLTIPKCVGSGSYTCHVAGTECLKNNPIVLWISFFINLVASVIGIGAIIMVIVAGLQYSAARDNPQAIQAAKQKMTNVLIGLAAFIFLYSFLQWLVPGGVF